MINPGKKSPWGMNYPLIYDQDWIGKISFMFTGGSRYAVPWGTLFK